MDTTQLPVQPGIIINQPRQPSSGATSNKSYLLKLFTGRLNRAGYFAGSIAAGVAITTLFVLIATALSFLVSMQIAILISLPIYIVGFTFFISSLTIRRLHDLNRSAYFSLIIIPGLLFSFLTLGLGVSGNVSKTSYIVSLINTIYKNGLYTAYIDISNLFGLYLLFWPGTKTMNKYGEVSNHWSIPEIFAFATPQSATPALGNPPTSKKLIKPFLIILIGLVVLLVLFIGGIFAYGFIQNFLNR